MMRDLVYALRLIRKRPWISLVAVISLALGIGVNTTIFSFANALIFRQPPVAQPSRMVEVYFHDPTPGAPLTGLYPLSYLDYKDFIVRQRTLSGLAVYTPGASANVATSADATGHTWNGQLVSSNYFSVLGVSPLLGRGFLPSEGEVAGSSPVLVISYGAWKSKLGGAPDVIGRTLRLNGLAYTIIGVAPRGFQGVMAGIESDWWAPITMVTRLGQPDMLTSRGTHSLFAVGRLKPGATVAQADADMNAVVASIFREHPNELPPGSGGTVRPLGNEPAPFRGFVGVGAGLLGAVVGLVLLIACANAALVLLVESLGRRREWALRSALGASRGRLIRQGLVHSILLALIASGLGLLLALWLEPLLFRLRPAGFPVGMDLGVNAHVLWFALGVALLTGVLFGLAPAWQGARVRILDNLKDGTPGGGSTRSASRSGLIIAQVALCVVVLVGAGLCLRSLEHASAIAPGFNTANTLFTEVNPAADGYTGDAAATFMERVRTTVAGLSGVRAAAWSEQVPLQLSESDTDILPAGMAPPPGQPGYDVDTARVGPDYFRAAGTRLLAGRGFTTADLAPGHPSLVVVNEALARKFWPHGAVGQSLTLASSKGKTTATIVGVAENGKYRTLGESPRPYLFQLVAINGPAYLIVGAQGPAAAFQNTLTRTLSRLDPNLGTDQVQTGAQFMQVPLFPARFTGILLGGFGLLALMLAVVGLYGVIAASVAQRTREYGIRMALGAGGGDLMRQVLGQGLRLAAWGIGVGVVLALLATQAMQALLYGMSSLDPLSYLAAAAVLLLVTAGACLAPALRATRVDPLKALRWE